MTNFVPAEEVYAIVKEELNSYFSAGSVTDTMFPKWAEMCMARFIKTALPKKSAFIPIKNYMAELPEDFDSVDSIWVCALIGSVDMPNPSSYYYQKDCRITEINDRCNECFDPCDNNLPKKDERYRVTHKVTGVTHFDYHIKYLLKPGNKTTREFCHKTCSNLSIDSYDTFDIQGCQIVTSFREGYLHLNYYSTNISEEDGLLIPDNVFIKDYLIKYLKYKVFETLSNVVTDETFNQVQLKLNQSENAMNIAREIAKTELKKWDKYQTSDMIKKRKNRFSNYRRALR